MFKRIETTPIFLLLHIAIMVSSPARAQWLNQPSLGIPRLANGKANLTAPAPRTSYGKPDLSGLWRASPNNSYGLNIVVDLKAEDTQRSARALYDQRLEDLGKGDPSVYQCLPFGPRTITSQEMSKVLQTQELIMILFEDLTYRQIFLDGRSLPQDPNPSWMGYSTGHWDADTLVVESNGFNERTWLDGGGHPHSEELRITERYRRRDFGHLELSVTLSDVKVTAQPWTINLEFELAPDTDLIEYICAENERDRPHLVGKASDDKKLAVKVASEILSKYVGVYEMLNPENPGAVYIFNVTLEGDELFIDMAGKNKQLLTPLSDTSFASLFGGVQFSEDRGAVTHFTMKSVEGDFKGIRK